MIKINGKQYAHKDFTAMIGDVRLDGITSIDYQAFPPRMGVVRVAGAPGETFSVDPDDGSGTIKMQTEEWDRFVAHLMGVPSPSRYWLKRAEFRDRKYRRHRKLELRAMRKAFVEQMRAAFPGEELPIVRFNNGE